MSIGGYIKSKLGTSKTKSGNGVTDDDFDMTKREVPDFSEKKAKKAYTPTKTGADWHKKGGTKADYVPRTGKTKASGRGWHLGMGMTKAAADEAKPPMPTKKPKMPAKKPSVAKMGAGTGLSDKDRKMMAKKPTMAKKKEGFNFGAAIARGFGGDSAWEREKKKAGVKD